MIFFHEASSISNVLPVWSRQVRTELGKAPLRPVTVIVPNMDLARWFQINMAEKEGISANLEFVLPAAYFRKLYEAENPDAKQTLLDKPMLQWMMYRLLREGDSVEEWVVLKEWQLAALRSRQSGTENRPHSDSEREVVRWNLASLIADVFDQYILFRPDWLECWRKGEVATDLTKLDARNQWQPSLWRRLTETWPEIPNRVDMMSRFLEKEVSRENPDNKPPLFLVEVAGAPPPILEALVKTAASRNLHWYSVSAITESDIAPDPLFDGLNFKKYEFRQLLNAFAQKHGITLRKTDKAEASASKTEASPDHSPSFLEILQHELRKKGPSANEIDLREDLSFRIHRCHSPRREVEVLRDRLLHTFANADIRPGDVAIVCPDPELYHPYIEEVFNTAGSDGYTIPVKSGVQQKESDITDRIFLEGLDLATSRFKLNEVLNWLEYPHVLGKILEATGQKSLLHEWLKRLNIRWGESPEHIRDLELDSEGRFTWEYGLDRLLLSWIASDNEDYVFADQLAGPPVNGSDATALLGRVSTVLKALSLLRKKKREPQPVDAWIGILGEFTNSVFSEDEQVSRLYLDKQIQELGSKTSLLRIDEPIPFEVIVEHFKSGMGSAGLGRSYQPGNVTFTGMMALHQIPFKVVALLGMNDGAIPGSTPTVSFDLIRSNPRAGDRARRDADRQLFLDYLLATQKVLHISYTAFSENDDSVKAPSVLISMLEDFIERKWPGRNYASSQNVNHLLQPFSKTYFDNSQKEFFSYSSHNLYLAKQLLSESKDKSPMVLSDRKERLIPFLEMLEERGGLDIAEVYNFYRNPAQFFLKNVLRLSYGTSDELSEVDAEPLVLDGLQSWDARRKSLVRWLENGETDLAGVRKRLHLDATLPDGLAGDLAFQKIENEYEDYTERVLSILKRPPQTSPKTMQFRIPIEDEFQILVSGEVQMDISAGVLVFEFGSQNARRNLKAWIYHIFANLEASTETWLFTNSDKPTCFRPLEKEEAEHRFRNLMFFFKTGLLQPLPYFPEISSEYLKKIRGTSKTAPVSPERAMQDLVEMLDFDEKPTFSDAKFDEISDVWVREAFGDSFPLHQTLEASGDRDITDPGKLQLAIPAMLEESPEVATLDLRGWNLFTLTAVYITGCMEADRKSL